MNRLFDGSIQDIIKDSFKYQTNPVQEYNQGVANKAYE